ncbi:hypothetical protein GCM10023235_00380 [Kitasatospora terrestris]|uniref:Uncharacterized protein n=1 Tax=Kitasatospora terrestris TaxID=258051 RepID=A0ABP9DC47_9ACTN
MRSARAGRRGGAGQSCSFDARGSELGGRSAGGATLGAQPRGGHLVAQVAGLAQDPLGGTLQLRLQHGQRLDTARIIALAATGLLQALEEPGGTTLDSDGELQEPVVARRSGVACFDARGNEGIRDGVLLVHLAAAAVGPGGAGAAAVDRVPAQPGGAQPGPALRAAGSRQLLLTGRFVPGFGAQVPRQVGVVSPVSRRVMRLIMATWTMASERAGSAS